MYPPNNTTVYNRAFIGAISGFYSAQFPPGATDAWYASLADQWAQAVDTAFGSGTPNCVELGMIEELSSVRWQNQGPQVGMQTTAQSYAAAATQMVALVLAGSAQIVAEGISPNTCSQSSGGTGSLAYQQTTFNLAALNALGAVTSGQVSAPALPAGARVMAGEIINDVTFAAEGLTTANGYLWMPNGDGVRAPASTTNDPNLAGTAGDIYACALAYGTGHNVFATQGGNQPNLVMALAGGPTFATLFAGQVTLRVYYAIL